MLKEITEKDNSTKSFAIDDFLPECREIVKEFLCPLCNHVYSDPISDKCGHVFCRKCIMSHIETNNKCPINNEEDISSESFCEIKFVQRLINKQSLYCINKNKGCSWIGLYSDLNTHFNDCSKEKIHCQFKGCSIIEERESMHYHQKECRYRIVQCENCFEQMAFYKLDDHVLICPKVKLMCSQLCGSIISRDEIFHHVKEVCPNTIIDCPFIKVGCRFKTTKRELPNHFIENVNDHHLLIATSIAKHNQVNQDNIIDLRQKFDKVEKVLNVLCNNMDEVKTHLVDEVCIIINEQLQKKRNRDEDTPLTTKLAKNVKSMKIEEIIDMEYDPDESEHPLFLFSNKDNFQIENNKITLIPKKKSNSHHFVFINSPLEKDMKIILSFSSAKWMAFGAADYNVLKSKNFSFSNYDCLNHGTFMLSSNGYLFNSNVKDENNKKIKDFSFFKSDEDIIIKYIHSKKTLQIKNGDNRYNLHSIKSSSGGKVFPCIAMLHPNEEITVKRVIFSNE